MSSAVGHTFTGFKRNETTGRLEIYYRGVLVGTANASSFGAVGTVTSAGLTSTTTITAGTSLSATTSIASTTTMTAGTGLTVTANNATVTAGDMRVTAGNTRMGTVSAFATTQPVSALVMKVGTAPAGAVATSGGVYTDGVSVLKIIADGTATNVET